VVIDGQPVQSVTGGGHWGGGMFINAYDMARFGTLTLRRGKWGDGNAFREWIGMALTPTGLQSPLASSTTRSMPTASSCRARGDGLHACRQRAQHDLCRSENDLVAVVRWIDNNAADGCEAADRGGGDEELGPRPPTRWPQRSLDRSLRLRV